MVQNNKVTLLKLRMKTCRVPQRPNGDHKMASYTSVMPNRIWDVACICMYTCSYVLHKV